MSIGSKRKHKIFFRSVAAPLIIVVLAGIMSISVANRFQDELLERFEKDANNSLQITTIKLDNYRDLLYAGRAFILSSQSVTAPEWRLFYNQQSIFERYPGVSSIAYVNSVATQDLAAFQARMKSNDYYGPTYALQTMSDRPKHGLASVYVSQNDVSAIVGLDLFSSEDRSAVYRAAEGKGTIVASPPLKLATGYQGFISVLPVYKGDQQVDGYILTSFRYADLMKQLFEDDSFGYRVSDVTTREPKQIYRSKSWTQKGYNYTQTLVVGDRQWKIEMSHEVERRPIGYLLPPAIIATALVLGVTLYSYSSSTIRAREKL